MTFKIPHAVAALDAGVVDDAGTLIKYDGRALDRPLWRADHTLATAMRYSVLWYFQVIASRLGAARERAYLEALDYGNRDASSGLTTFWLGGSLAISPEEQQRFLLDLYADRLRVGPRAADAVRQISCSPTAASPTPTASIRSPARWPAGTVVAAKTGSGNAGGGLAVRWLVGHASRGPRAWVFVSNVIGGAGDAGARGGRAGRARPD